MVSKPCSLSLTHRLFISYRGWLSLEPSGPFHWRLSSRLYDASTGAIDEDRASVGYEVFMRLSQLAVASGMYGNLIGLVKMLSNMDDPTAIGPAMAVALLTLFYGIILGEFIFKSMATSFITRTESKIIRSSRGFMTIYFSLFTLFVLMSTFFLMLLSFADFNH